MPKNSKSRKKHSAKPISIPTTAGFANEMVANAYFFAMAAETGHFSLEGWKEITKVVMTLSFATDEAKVHKADKEAIDNSVFTLMGISDRQVATNVWSITEAELSNVKRGICASDRLIGKLNYKALSAGYGYFRLTIGQIK